MIIFKMDDFQEAADLAEFFSQALPSTPLQARILLNRFYTLRQSHKA